MQRNYQKILGLLERDLALFLLYGLAHYISELLHRLFDAVETCKYYKVWPKIYFLTMTSVY